MDGDGDEEADVAPGQGHAPSAPRINSGIIAPSAWLNSISFPGKPHRSEQMELEMAMVTAIKRRAGLRQGEPGRTFPPG